MPPWFFGRHIARFRLSRRSSKSGPANEQGMKNSIKILLREAQCFKDGGDFLAAKLVAQEALTRGGGDDALALLDRMDERVREVYLPEELADSENYFAEMQKESGRFSITRNTEVNLDGATRYFCPKPCGQVYLGREGVSFCPYAPELPCDSRALSQRLTALRLTGERVRATLLLNQNSLCAGCPKLMKLPVAEAGKSAEVLEICISAVRPGRYDLFAALELISARLPGSFPRRYVLEEPLLAGQDEGEIKRIINFMRRNRSGRALFHVDPQSFSTEIFDVLVARRAELICEFNEHSGERAWENLRRYCASGNPQQITVNFTFQDGALTAQNLQEFLSRCFVTGCRKLSVTFNERLEADDCLLGNKDFLERSAFALGMDLHIDQESLDTAIFNRKTNLRRAQTDWAPGALSPITGRTCAQSRYVANNVVEPVSHAVGEN